MLVKSQVKYIQSLSQKKLRDQEDSFVAEGPKIINELLAATNVDLKQLYATETWILENQSQVSRIGAERIISVSPKELERISFLTSPNEVLGIFKKPEFSAALNMKGMVTLLLDAIQDPGNLGTIIRCADWFGITQVICSEECADVFSQKVIQSTMGSISRVRVEYLDPNLFLEEHKDVPVFAALLNGKDLHSFPKIKEGIILIGNESKGIRSSLINSSVQQLTIPRKGGAESLNAAVATGIILSQLT